MCSDYEEVFARKYSRLVNRLVRPFFLKGGERDDLYQEGMIGLLLAMRKYDPAKSDNFEAFAAICIKNRLYDAVKADISFSNKELETAEKLKAFAADLNNNTLFNPESLLLASESAEEIQSALGGLLSAFESSVLGPYLEGYSVNEIALALKREPKSVDNAIQRIRRKAAKYLQGDNRH